MPKLIFAGLGMALCAFLVGCSDGRNSEPKTFKMGEEVRIGSLVYTVLDTDWLDQIPDTPTPRLPQHHFLSVRLSVTNSGTAVSGVPALTLTDARGNFFSEISDAKSLTEWLGYIRSIRPSETLHGRVLFDAPLGPYKLKLSDDSDPDEQKTANVDLPVELTKPQIRTEVPVSK